MQYSDATENSLKENSPYSFHLLLYSNVLGDSEKCVPKYTK